LRRKGGDNVSKKDDRAREARVRAAIKPDSGHAELNQRK